MKYWYQLQIQANANNADWISDILLAFGAQAVSLLDAKNQPLLEPAPGEMPLWNQAWVSGLFTNKKAAQTTLDQLHTIPALCQISSRLIVLPHQNWHQAWLAYFQPLRFGKKLWISPSACLNQIPVNERDHVLIFEPGLAFGTGTHPSTALCLTWLESHLCAGNVLMDYGCGSGILALAALKLGANFVYAVDIDPQALTATKKNAQDNGFPLNQLQISFPNELSIKPVDILVANILANPLIQLAKSLADLTKVNGKIVLAGLLAEQIDSVKLAYQPWFNLTVSASKENWVLLVGKKHHP